MNKALPFIFITCSLAFTGEKIKNDLEKENLKGMVKTIRENNYNLHDNETDSSWLDGDTRDYNKKGNITDDEIFSMDSSFSGDSSIIKAFDLLKKRFFKYDSKNKLMGWDDSDFHNYLYKTILNDFHKNILNYDKKGNVVEDGDYDYTNNPDGILIEKETFNYDDKGNLSETKWYDSNDSMVSKETDTYDDKGNIIESDKYLYSHGNHSIPYSSTCLYDKKGNKIDEKYNPLCVMYDRQIGEAKYLYDAQGNVIHQLYYNAKDYSFSFDRTYTYTYDKYGNWLTKIKFKNNIPIYLEKREITYY